MDFTFSRFDLKDAHLANGGSSTVLAGLASVQYFLMPGPVRPYLIAGVGAYGISTDVVVPDSYDRENEIRQNLRDENEVAFGWDANAGVDFNVRDKWSIDVGVRYLHSYDVPQQLGAGSVRIEPDYFQLKIGVGFNPARL